jgi:hypothetical protein
MSVSIIHIIALLSGETTEFHVFDLDRGTEICIVEIIPFFVLGLF